MKLIRTRQLDLLRSLNNQVLKGSWASRTISLQKLKDESWIMIIWSHGRPMGEGRGMLKCYIFLLLFRKKGCFRSFEQENEISPFCPALAKSLSSLEKSTIDPGWKKPFRRPWMKYGYFLPKSEESSHEPSAQCMFFSVKYSNQRLSSSNWESFEKQTFIIHQTSPRGFSSNSTNIRANS